MPNGYLKNAGGAVGIRLRRGGGSQRWEKKKQRDCTEHHIHEQAKVPKKGAKAKAFKSNSKGGKANSPNHAEMKEILLDASFLENHYSLESWPDQSVYDNKPRNRQETLTRECMICCEIAPLISLTRNCRHELACLQCLRTMYLQISQKDVSLYPLRCFGPTCRREIRATNLLQAGIIQRPRELAKHYRLSTLAKAYQTPGATTIHCPTCDHPRLIRSSTLANGHSGLHTFQCVSCRCCYAAPTGLYALVEALDNMALNKHEYDDGWARCPACHIIISKGLGCDHMTCLCGFEFSWKRALCNKMNSLSLPVGHIGD